ncbi:Uncharacterised protein [uncultured archaeon]|nr:Uncharacterised protein [uncultured archaeon]
MSGLSAQRRVKKFHVKEIAKIANEGRWKDAFGLMLYADVKPGKIAHLCRKAGTPLKYPEAFKKSFAKRKESLAGKPFTVFNRKMPQTFDELMKECEPMFERTNAFYNGNETRVRVPPSRLMTEMFIKIVGEEQLSKTLGKKAVQELRNDSWDIKDN